MTSPTKRSDQHAKSPQKEILTGKCEEKPGRICGVGFKEKGDLIHKRKGRG